MYLSAGTTFKIADNVLTGLNRASRVTRSALLRAEIQNISHFRRVKRIPGREIRGTPITAIYIIYFVVLKYLGSRRGEMRSDRIVRTLGIRVYTECIFGSDRASCRIQNTRSSSNFLPRIALFAEEKEERTAGSSLIRRSSTTRDVMKHRAYAKHSFPEWIHLLWSMDASRACKTVCVHTRKGVFVE